MQKTFQDNLTLRKYMRLFTFLGLSGIWQVYQLYRYSYYSWNFFSVFVVTNAFGLATFGFLIKTIRIGKRLLNNRKLHQQAARFIVWEIIILNSFTITLALAALIYGEVYLMGGTLDYILETLLLNVSITVAVFYPLHTLAITLSVWVLITLRKQNPNRFGSEFPDSQQVKQDLALSDPSQEKDAIIISDVSISSVIHLEQFTKICKSTSQEKLAKGQISIPPGFPYSFNIYSQQKYPVVTFARGSLKISDDEIVFRAINKPMHFLKIITLPFYNMNSEYKFRVKPSDVSYVGWHKFAPNIPGLPPYEIDWVKLMVANEEILLADITPGPTMKQTHERTRELFQHIRRWYQKHKGFDG